MVAVVRSIQVGRPRTLAAGNPEAKEWRSAIFKLQVQGAVAVRKTNIEGDQQADLVHHGGLDKAVLAYSSHHFETWNRTFPEKYFEGGAFGENLTIDGLEETEVCVGDVYETGTCVLQVSQPRQPCWKLSRKWNLPRLAAIVQETGRTGWYLRVLEEGQIEAGNQLQLIARPHPEISVAWAHSVMHAKPRKQEEDRKLAECPLLSDSWRQQLRRRAQKTEEHSDSTRLFGNAAEETES